METLVQKWGNSLGIRIPAHLSKQFSLHAGSKVSIEADDEKIVIRTVKYNLDDMLQAITPQNSHSVLLDDESAKGNEEW